MPSTIAAEVQTITAPLTDADRAEYQRLKAEIRVRVTACYREIAPRLKAIFDGQLWREDYISQEEFCLEEFGFKPRRARQLLQAEAIAVNVEATTAGNRFPANDRVALALAPLPPDQQGPAFDAAIERYGDAPSTGQVQAIVSEQTGKPTGKSRVNGQVVDDPPDIAEKRASGKIPANAVPDIEEPDEPTTLDAVAEEIAERRAIQDDISDQDWLARLPLSSVLADVPLRTFQAEAIAYRHLEPKIKQFGKEVATEFNRTRREGPLQSKLRWGLKVDPPSRWVRCAAKDQGGCGGIGTVSFGECPECRGKGYRINS